jgi:hypothetical protein
MIGDWLCGFAFVLATVVVLATPAYVALIRMSLSAPNGIDMGRRLNVRVSIAATIAVVALAWIFGQVFDAARLSDMWY